MQSLMVRPQTLSHTEKPVLYLGCKQDEVIEIHDLLTQWGIHQLHPSNDFDLGLEAAIKIFQHRFFLKEDGIVGPLTWQALLTGAPVNMPLLMQGSVCPTVVTLQRVLQVTGDYKGMIDGEFGPLTDQAVRAFQRKQGIAVDGFVTFRTWYALSRTSH